MKKWMALLLTVIMVMCSFGAAMAEEKTAELNIMMSSANLMEQWQDFCDQFAAKVLAEQNIKVKINLEMPASGQYDSVLQARLNGGDAPDVYMIHCNNLNVYTKAKYTTDLTQEAFTAQLFESVRKTVTLEDGKVYAAPLENQAWGVLYNKEIFEECGLKTPDTLTELKAACETLKAKGYTPFMLAFQEQWVPQLMTALTLGGKVSGELPDWVDRMYKDEGSYEEVREIFDVIQLIMANGTKRAMEEGSEAGAADFAMGAAAMFVQGTWAEGSVMTANPDMKVGVMPLPINDNPGCTMLNMATSSVLCVYPKSTEKELALQFINYIYDEEVSSQLFQACTYNPVAACHTYEPSQCVASAAEFLAAGRAYEELVLPSAVTDEQGKLLQELYVGTVTVDEIITRLDAAFQNANKLN